MSDVERRLRVAVLGSGQIGTDLAIKLSKHDEFEIKVVAGRRGNSPGLDFVSKRKIATSTQGIQTILDLGDEIDLVFDCTSASDHKIHWPLLKRAGISAIDLTPAKLGIFYIPNVTPPITFQFGEPVNINLVTCGGQSASPLVHAIKQVARIARIEVASNIASLSAGPATRANIDEYLATTEDVLLKISGAAEAKAILVLNPAEPPITMQNTLYFSLMDHESTSEALLNDAISTAIRGIQKYVPGYRSAMKSSFVQNEFVVSVLVKGRGDYLPAYSGNLDIINSTAIEAALEFATALHSQESFGG